MWRSPATSFVGYRAPGGTDRLLGSGRTRRPHAFKQLVDRCLVRHGPYLRRLRLRLLHREQVDHLAPAPRSRPVIGKKDSLRRRSLIRPHAQPRQGGRLHILRRESQRRFLLRFRRHKESVRHQGTIGPLPTTPRPSSSSRMTRTTTTTAARPIRRRTTRTRPLLTIARRCPSTAPRRRPERICNGWASSLKP